MGKKSSKKLIKTPKANGAGNSATSEDASLSQVDKSIDNHDGVDVTSERTRNGVQNDEANVETQQNAGEELVNNEARVMQDDNTSEDKKVDAPDDTKFPTSSDSVNTNNEEASVRHDVTDDLDVDITPKNGNLAIDRKDSHEEVSAKDNEGSEGQSLRAQLEQIEIERDEIQEEYDNLLEKVASIKQKLGERFKVLEAETESAKKEAEKAKKETEIAKKEAASARVEAEHARCDVKSSKKEAEDARKEISDSKTRLKQLELEKDDARKDANAMKSQSVSQKIMFDQELLNERMNRESLEVEIVQLNASSGDTENVASQSAQTTEVQEKQIMQSKAESDVTKVEHEKYRSESRSTIERIERERDVLNQELLASRNQSAELAKSSQGTIETQQKLELEAKENQLLIGKSRHEAVILNDHLTQALRMIRKDSEGSTVDKESVSNLFVQFATCPRQDTKKFEILQVIANFLNWDERRRQDVGLMRSEDFMEASDLPPTQMVGFVGRLAEYSESKRR